MKPNTDEKKKGKKKRKERFRFIKTERRWGRKERKEKYMMEGNMSTEHNTALCVFKFLVV